MVDAPSAVNMRAWTTTGSMLRESEPNTTELVDREIPDCVARIISRISFQYAAIIAAAKGQVAGRDH
eukprot:1371558-Rhodomonas_salina.2